MASAISKLCILLGQDWYKEKLNLIICAKFVSVCLYDKAPLTTNSHIIILSYLYQQHYPV